MNLGLINKLTVAKVADYGYILIDQEGIEVVLAKGFAKKALKEKDEIDVFVTKNAAGQFQATTKAPKIKLDEFAYLEVKELTKEGALMDWGMPDYLMVPPDEQVEVMVEGYSYLVYLFLDDETELLMGSCRENDILFFEDIELEAGQEVDVLVYRPSDLGLNAVINDLYKGLIFTSDIHKEIKPGDRIKAYVKNIRDDGKVDLVLEKPGFKASLGPNTKVVMEALNKNKGYLKLNDKTPPYIIKRELGLSKKAFKRAIGNLYKAKQILLTDEGIKLVK